MANSSGPVALGLGGVATILLISGIQGKSISEVLRGNFGGASSNPTGNITPTGITSPTGVESFPGAPQALPPNQVPLSEPKNSRKCQELQYGLRVALQYKEELGVQVLARKITQKAGEEQFHSKYPWYAQWAQEARKCI